MYCSALIKGATQNGGVVRSFFLLYLYFGSTYPRFVSGFVNNHKKYNLKTQHFRLFEVILFKRLQYKTF